MLFCFYINKYTEISKSLNTKKKKSYVIYIERSRDSPILLIKTDLYKIYFIIKNYGI